MSHWIIAEGPKSLEVILNHLLTQDKRQHYVLYQLNGQQSMIQIDTRKTPFTFVYHDLMNRAVTSPVLATLANFLWKQSGNPAQVSEEIKQKFLLAYFKEFTQQKSKQEMLRAVSAGQNPNVNLMKITPEEAIRNIQQNSITPEVAAGRRTYGLWKRAWDVISGERPQAQVERSVKVKKV